jgi:hypothetical protein
MLFLITRDLSNNLITHISVSTFAGLDRLEFLYAYWSPFLSTSDLSFNDFKSLPFGSLSPLAHLTELFVLLTDDSRLPSLPLQLFPLLFSCIHTPPSSCIPSL